MNKPEQKPDISQRTQDQLLYNGFRFSSTDIRIDAGRIITQEQFEIRKQKAKEIKLP
jgi:hypothetical protein